MSQEVLIGVTGGVAAYKTATLVSRLVQRGVGVTVVMTEGAARFVGPSTFAALSGRPVAQHVFDPFAFPFGAHIELARRATVLCVAPASADFLAKAAAGAADDLLSTLLLSFTGRVLLAPAMNAEMWAKPSVQRNVAQVVADGAQLVGPGDGWQSCRDVGPGRMAEPEELIDAVMVALGAPNSPGSI